MPVLDTMRETTHGIGGTDDPGPDHHGDLRWIIWGIIMNQHIILIPTTIPIISMNTCIMMIEKNGGREEEAPHNNPGHQ